MADATTDVSSPCSDNFAYEGMKKAYLEQVEMYYSNKRLPIISPYTRKVVDRIKHIIKEKQVLMAAGHPSEHTKYKVADRYEVIERKGVEILIIKRLEPDDRIVHILPAEDCFDILMNAHLKTMHGGKDKILQAISGKYVVPKTSIDFLLVVCEVCRLMGSIKLRADKNIPQKFNSRAQVSIIDMTSQSDNQFKYILCYLDRFTNFMLLRPLMTNSVEETAMELMKIFLDFGPPEKIETYNRPFFQKVTSLINTAHRKFDIPLVLPVKMPDITPNNVRSMLQKWTIDNNCSNWAMGCYLVQWNNNSTSKINQLKSPYESVFKNSSPNVASSSRGNLHENEKSSEAELNNDTVIDNDLNPTDVENNSSSPIILESDNDTNSQTVLVDDGDVTVVNEGTAISDDDDDCLITFTEIPTEPVTAVIPNKQLSANAQKRPNILTKRTSVEDASPNVPTGNNPNNNPRKGKPNKQAQSKKLPAPTNTKCHICRTGIKKAYICTKCNRNVHLFCSDRLLQPNISADVLTVTCTSCRLCNSRLEKLKRKFDEMDGDKTNVTIKH